MTQLFLQIQKINAIIFNILEFKEKELQVYKNIYLFTEVVCLMNKFFELIL